MISVVEAQSIILSRTRQYGTALVTLESATNRILAEDVYADRDFPPFNRVAMDGICIQHSYFQQGQRQFEVCGVQAAGSAQLLLEEGKALEVMTGASLPHQADTVIRYEDLSIQNGTVTINVDSVKKGQNIHKQGSDHQQGDQILSSGKKIRPTEVAILATVGKAQVNVLKLPKIAIVSTGDELVDIDTAPLPHQIRKSNVHALSALLKKYCIEADLIHLPDNRDKINQTLKHLLNKYDAILMSGAVSKGKFDFIPEALDHLGVEKHFHRVAQRPGKPFWFGTTSSCVVFAFPGNPVSTFACAVRFFDPWLKKSLKLETENLNAILSKPVHFKPSLTYFMQVKTYMNEGKLMAEPCQGNGSGDLANLSNVNGFLELPADNTTFQEGEVFRLWPF